jgi:hypothetical protein
VVADQVEKTRSRADGISMHLHRLAGALGLNGACSPTYAEGVHLINEADRIHDGLASSALSTYLGVLGGQSILRETRLR